MTRTHARHDARAAAEARQYTQLLQTVQRAARAYQRRTGARINWDSTTPEDLAADAYIIAREAPGRPEDRPGDKLRRAAYEAARQAVRAQQRHHHADLSDEDGSAVGATRADDVEDAAAIRYAISHAGPVAVMLAQGLTIGDISARLSVSRPTAWRLAARAKEQVRAALV